MMRVILETPRLRLREMGAEDIDFMAEMLGDPDVMHYYPHTLDRDGARGWLDNQLQRYERDGHAFWLVEGRDDGKAKGQVGLLKQTLEDGVSFIRPENIPSQKVAWKLGMEPERMIQRGGWDHLVYRVERSGQSGAPTSGPSG
jgi:RimJ/RimL family protein N-acetyltransferase